MEAEYDFSNARRGAVVATPRGKTRITIRLDSDLLDWFRNQVEVSGGGNYQSLINAALREYVTRESGGLEEVVRRVLREELARLRVPA